MRFAIALTLAAVMVVGCGTTARRSAKVRAVSSERGQRTCEWKSHGFRTCATFDAPNPRATIERHSASGDWVVVTGPLPRLLRATLPYTLGYWRFAKVSPDGRTLLAQWSGECESPNAFFVPARGGAPRPVTGERNWSKAPESSAIGWAEDGRALVRLLGPACGIGAHRPGVYLINPNTGAATFVRKLTHAEGG